MDINIWDAFEQLDADEKDTMPGTDKFQSLYIEPSELGISSDPNSIDLVHPCTNNLITEFNNKAGSLAITYTLAMHYYHKGIPDDPWFISPGKNGESVQYMPNFEPEHWGRRYWFNYYVDTYYLKIMSLWDSILEILNHYYGYNFAVDLSLRNKLLATLKRDHNAVYNVFDQMRQDVLYTDAQKYRNAAAHGTSPSNVTNTVSFEKDTECEVLDHVEDGKAVMKTVHGTRVSMNVGKYTKVADIARHMDDFAVYCGEKIHAILLAAK